MQQPFQPSPCVAKSIGKETGEESIVESFIRVGISLRHGGSGEECRGSVAVFADDPVDGSACGGFGAGIGYVGCGLGAADDADVFDGWIFEQERLGLAEGLVVEGYAFEVRGAGDGWDLGLGGHAGCVDELGGEELLIGVVDDFPIHVAEGTGLGDFGDAFDVGVE